MSMLSRLPIAMLDGKVAIDVGQVGTSLVIKYADGTFQYINMDEFIAKASKIPDFYFSMANRVGAIQRGTSVTDQVTVVPTKGFNNPVTFSARDVPTGVFVKFLPKTTPQFTEMTITCDRTAKIDQVILAIDGTDSAGGLVRSFDVILNITAIGSGAGVVAAPATQQSTGGPAMQGVNAVAGQSVSPAAPKILSAWKTVTPADPKAMSISHHTYTVVHPQKIVGKKPQNNKASRAKSNRKIRS